MAVLLAKFEHMSYADIGTVMDMSPQAVKSLLSRARSNLREALQPYLDRGAPNHRTASRFDQRESAITFGN